MRVESGLLDLDCDQGKSVGSSYKIITLINKIKGHSQLWDCVDLNTGFHTLKKVHPNLESKFI